MPKFRSWDEVIGDSDSASNNKSWLARAGSFGQQYTDPLYWIFGEKYTNQLEKWADKSNSFLSKIAKQDPVVQFDRRNNPIQDTEEGEHVGDWAENKPLDSIAMTLGAIFGGGALMGGGAGAGGGTAGGVGGGTGSAVGGGLGVMGGSLPAGMEGVVVTGSSGSALPAAIGGGAAGASTANSNGNDWRKYTRNMSQQQNTQSSGPNAYEQFLDNQDKAMRVAQALSNNSRGSQSDDYQEQVARQKQRRAIAEAMMQRYA